MKIKVAKLGILYLAVSAVFDEINFIDVQSRNACSVSCVPGNLISLLRMVLDINWTISQDTHIC